MTKRPVKIGFSGFWKGFDENDNFITRAIRKEFEPVISEKPDYLFFSVFDDGYINYPQDSVRIFFSGESETPDFNLTDYAMSYDWIDFADRYERVPLYLFYPGTCAMSENRGGMMAEPYIRDKFCSFVCSNGDGDKKRLDFFHELSKLKRVDSGGRYENNVGGAVSDKIGFESKYRFSICFENSPYPGYTTEKILQAFAAGTIPIYRGDPLVTKVFNPKAFIDANGYEDMQGLAKYVCEIDNDRERMLSMLKESPFNEGYSIAEQKQRAEGFILSIFRQEKEGAFRRNRTFWGVNYEKRRKRYLNINAKLRRFRNILSRG